MDIVRPQHRSQPVVKDTHIAAKRPKRNILPFILIPLFTLLIAGGVYMFATGAFAAQRINKDAYQVVYLTNGQAYFGKLQNTEGSYLYVSTPYAAQDVKDEANKDAQATTTLLKVSSQLYGPEDSIAIRSDQVSFWQNLRDDSKVVQAMKNK